MSITRATARSSSSTSASSAARASCRSGSAGTETSLGTGFALFPNFQAHGTCSVGSGQCTINGTLANYYIYKPISGPSVGEVATGGPLNFAGYFTVPTNVLAMLPGQLSLGTPDIVVTRSLLRVLAYST